MAIIRELPILQSFPVSVQTVASPLRPSEAKKIEAMPKPPWFKIRPPSGSRVAQIRSLLADPSVPQRQLLSTVCQEAHCPNLSECWQSGTATFMLGGEFCTRACRFCAVKTSRNPAPLDEREPIRVAEAVQSLKLEYVVLTSVDRDDIQDGGADHFARCIEAIIQNSGEKRPRIEALMPDFQGDTNSIERIVSTGLDVYAHNIETVERLQKRVRDPRANYQQSLKSLQYAQVAAKKLGIQILTKSALMLGLGESQDEVLASFEDLLEHGVQILTLGQYLRPSLEHLPVEYFWTPEEFDHIGVLARKAGFSFVAAGPLVRSSYKAAEVFISGVLGPNKQSKENVSGISITRAR